MKSHEKIIIEIFDQFDNHIREKVIKDLSESYSQLLREIDKRGLMKRNNQELPRLSHFLKSLFLYVFEKLHKGDKLEADKLVSELKTQVNLLEQRHVQKIEPEFIVDDTTYAQEEFHALLQRYDEELRSNIKRILIDSYNKAKIEISQKNLVYRSGYPEPKLEKFVKYVFSFVFAKLHRGDRQRASEILSEELAKLDNHISSNHHVIASI